MPTVFLSHAREDVALAEEIALKARQAGVRVFLADSDIGAAQPYDEIIRKSIAKADGFVFLASRHSLAADRFTHTELKLAKARWPDPAGRVLTVLIDERGEHDLPPYLKAVASVTRPQGDKASSVVTDILATWPPASGPPLLARLAAVLVAVGLVAALGFAISQSERGSKDSGPSQAERPDPAAHSPLGDWVVDKEHLFEKTFEYWEPNLPTAADLANQLGRELEIKNMRDAAEGADAVLHFKKDKTVFLTGPMGESSLDLAGTWALEDEKLTLVWTRDHGDSVHNVTPATYHRQEILVHATDDSPVGMRWVRRH